MKRFAMICACSAALSIVVPTLSAAQYYPYFSPEGGPPNYYERGRHGPYVFGYDPLDARGEVTVSRHYWDYGLFWQRCVTRRYHRHRSGPAYLTRRYCY
jgi:hypothetical protein